MPSDCAMLTAVLIEVGKWALGLYLGHGAIGSVFGAAGALAIMLVWLNYVSMILLFGAEVTAEVHRRRAKDQPPEDPRGSLRLVHPRARP